MKDIDKIALFAQSQGWHIEHTTRHLKFISPEGQFVILPATPSEWRGYQNALAQLRHAGLNPPKKRLKKKVHHGTDLRSVAIAESVGLDLTFVRYPHIEEIVGRWRDESWFDSEGIPLDAEEWGRFTDEELVAALLLGPATEFHVPDTEGGAYGVNRSKLLDRPSDRLLFIRLCAYKFWHDPDRPHDDLPPSLCWCGYNVGSFHDLALHIVKEHERGCIEHAPISRHLIPWSDPNDLRALMGEDAEDVEDLRLELAGERDRRRAAEEELAALKTRLKGILA